jgi:hypothetical protein
MMRMNTPKAPKRPDVNDPSQAAMEMFNQGMRAGPDGTLQPTQDFGGLLSKSSQGINSLTRGMKGGQMSSLGKPMNSMYDQNPGFFNRGGSAGGAAGFGQMLAQRGQTPTPTAQPAASPLPNDTPGAASTAARAGMMKPNAFSSAMKGVRPVDSALTEKRGFGKPDRFFAGGEGTDSPASKKFFVEGDPNAPKSVALSTQASNRAGLEDRASGFRLLREMSQTPLQIDRSAGGGSDTLIRGKYGKGFAANLPAGVKRPAGMEGDVNGVGFAEMMQGLANKQVNEGTWREGDRLPAGMTQEQAKTTNEAARQKILSRQRIAAKSK